MKLIDTKDIQSEILAILGQVSNIGYWSYSISDGHLFWSKTTKTIHEVSDDYVPNLAHAIKFYKEGYSRNTIENAVDNAVKTGEPYDVTLQIITKLGNEKWVRAIGRIEKEEEQVVRMYGTFQDIDKTMQQKIRLEELNNRVQVATAAANLGIWELDLDTDELHWDDKMYEIYGLEKTDFNAHYGVWESSLAPEDKERCIDEVQLAISEKREFDTQFSIIKGDGSRARIRAQAKLIKDSFGKPTKLIGVNSDISAKAIIEEQLEMMYKKNQQQNKYLSNFAHTITHNLRSSSGNLTMLITAIKEVKEPEKRAAFLGMMEKASERLENTIDELYETIKIRYGKKDSFSKVVLEHAFERACDNINALIDDSGAELLVNIPRGTEILGLNAYFESIFQNLLTNAIKYAKKGIPPKITVNVMVSKGKKTITFSDEGQGIDLNKYGDKLFGMYQTFHHHADAKGIGLHLTKNQVESMGGTITVESEPNAGTTFTITF